MSSPTTWHIVRRSLGFFRRSHMAIALGVAAATAVIVGALVVGDSVRGSLRGLVLDRLGNIECLLHARGYFDPAILPSLATSESNKATVVPAILLSSTTVEKRDENFQTLRASRVQLVAPTEQFWAASGDQQLATLSLGEDEVAINAALADELSAGVGDEITLRLQDMPSVPEDNPLGRREANTVSLPRQRVKAVLPDQGIGGLSLVTGQESAKNVFCNQATLQDLLECGKQVNAALVLSDTPSLIATETGQQWCDELNLQLHPSIEDYGLQLTRHRQTIQGAEAGSRENEPAELQEARAEDSAISGDESSDVVFDYFQLTSTELLLDTPTANAVRRKLGPDRSVRLMSYLANGIATVTPSQADLSYDRSAANYKRRAARADAQPDRRRVMPAESAVNLEEHRTPNLIAVPESVSLSPLDPEDQAPRQKATPELQSRDVPYSIVVGLDANSDLQLDRYTTISDEDLRIPYCWINSWLAQQLQTRPGEWVRLRFFEPETVDGREIEKSAKFMIAGIVPLTEPSTPYQRGRPATFTDPPTIFNDPDLTPTVPGVTDQDSISNWDTPFKLNLDLILDQDDAYWKNHRLTPKIFTDYRFAASQQFFGSRFGETTAIRFPADRVASEQQLRADLEEALLSTRQLRGLAFTPIRNQQLIAASGTTPFDQLFLALSFFVIVAALLLVMLLLKLGLGKRVEQLGVLYASGFTPSRVRSLLLREYATVALLGAALGIPLGLAYASLMVATLQSWWVGAIATPFLTFSFTWPSLTIGFGAGLIASIITLYFGLRRLSLVAPLHLLRGQVGPDLGGQRKVNRVSLAVAGFALFGVAALIWIGLGQGGMARAGTFFGSGMLLLAALLIAIRQWIESGQQHGQTTPKSGLLILALRAMSRNPVRSSLAIGLLSVASFLIASMGVFQISPSEKGYGGFNLVAQSSQPIYRNIGTGSVRSDILGEEDAAKLSGTTIISLRVRPGEDASCNNLFQVATPTILGVPTQLEELSQLSPDLAQFSWSDAQKLSAPWSSLRDTGTGEIDSPIPVILDQNTADWSLKQGSSIGSTVKIVIENRPLYFRTVGLLSNSILQGKLLIGAENFKQLFPKISGANYFLIRTDAQSDVDEVAATLEDGWSDSGLDVFKSEKILEKLLGVQNTYISAFQSLGALGLLLGSFGLVAVQLRSVIERRKELALMQAVGFSQGRISRMLVLETGLLLSLGLLIGIACAAIALAPFVIETGPKLSLTGPLIMLAVVLLLGLLAAMLAARSATRTSVLDGLRAE